MSQQKDLWAMNPMDVSFSDGKCFNSTPNSTAITLKSSQLQTHISKNIIRKPSQLFEAQTTIHRSNSLIPSAKTHQINLFRNSTDLSIFEVIKSSKFKQSAHKSTMRCNIAKNENRNLKPEQHYFETLEKVKRSNRSSLKIEQLKKIQNLTKRIDNRIKSNLYLHLR